MRVPGDGLWHRGMFLRAAWALGLVVVGWPGSVVSQTAGPSPYASYPTPAACVAAAYRVTQQVGWGEVGDTLPYDDARQVHADARATGAECLARLLPAGVTIASAPSRDIATRFFMGRALVDDSSATRAFQRFLGAQKIRDDSTTVIWHALMSYAFGLPTRLPEAQRMAAWLDTLGVVGERPFLPTDSIWFSQHSWPNELATARLDTAAMRRELGLMRVNYAAIPKGASRGAERTPIEAQAEELFLALLQHPRADSAVLALKAKTPEVLGPNPEAMGYGGMQLLGEPFGALHPDFWFHQPAGESSFPRPGHVTVIQYVVPHICTCEAEAAVAHRLKARFGDRLDLVVLAQTAGHFDRQVKLAPAEEAARLGRRILEGWRMDAAIGIYTTRFVPNPDPDRRLVAQPIEELQRVLAGSGTLIIDQRGVLVLAGFLSLGPRSELGLERIIGRLLEPVGQ